MKIEYGRQLDIKDVKDLSVDLMIFAGNHEKRVLTFFKSVRDIAKIKRLIIFTFKDNFPILGDMEHVTIKDSNQIYHLLDQIFASHTGDHFTLLVDYSCMTKSWYYSIMLFLANKNLNQRSVRVIFSYTPSKYSEPLIPKPNTDIAPLPGKYIIPTDKPKALIVCLGYEKNKAEGIIEHLDPKYCHVLYTRPSLDPMFSTKVEENNKSIIDEKTYFVTQYAFDDLLGLERILNTLYQTLKKDYSIIIAPLGPKPFALVSMAMAAKYPEIDIWRVGSGSNINEYDREPLQQDLFILNDIHFAPAH